jgi:hypothetical protein
MTDLLEVRANCVIFGIDLQKNKKYVFSLEEEDIALPYINVTSENKSCIKEYLMISLKEYIKEEYFELSNLEVNPQLVLDHTSYIQGKENTFNMIYGILMDYTDNIQNGYWHEFNYMNITKYHNLLFEVIREL